MDHIQASPAPGTLRVATFNIHHGADVGNDLNLERTARAIEELAADVVLLQEVDRYWRRSGGVDQPAWLADRLGMHSAFGPAFSRAPEGSGDPPREYGLVILSRHALDDVRIVPLPGSSATEPRILLSACIEVAGREITVATVHLDNLDAMVRIRQAEAVLASLPRGGRPVVLGGDFNDEVGGPSVLLLSVPFSNVWDSHGSGDGITFIGDGAWAPPGRIDHILTAGLRCTGTWVHDSSPRASDHLPLVAGFAW